MAEAKNEDSSKIEHTPGTLSTSLPAATEEQRHLAQQAADDFEKGNYDSCLAALNKLSSSRSRDPKVAHNKAVAEFYKRGMTRVEEFRNTLVGICAKVLAPGALWMLVFFVFKCGIWKNQQCC